MSGVSKFGMVLSLSTSSTPATLTTLLPVGLAPYPAAAESLEILSSDANDADGDTGMRSVRLQGLSAGWEFQEADIVLDGQTPVAIPHTWLRTFRMSGQTSGSSKANEGTITVQVAGGGDPRLNMLVDQGQTLHAGFTIPVGFRGFLKVFGSDLLPGTAVNTAAAHIGLFTRSNDQADRPWRLRRTTDLLTSKQFLVPMELDSKTDVELRVLFVEKNGTSISGSFDLVLRTLEDERRALPNYVT